jgi:hypothetical protein
MRPATFDEVRFFRAVQESGARALLIGRRALVLLGLPVLTVLVEGVNVLLPSIDDLIQTKRFGSRPKDLEDIRLLEVLRREGEHG